MYECESWTIKKGRHWRIDAFELWCWRRLLRVPWIARRSNQSILKEISPEYSLEGLMLKLKLQYFGHLMQRTGSLEKTLMLAKIEGQKRSDNRGWDGWMASPTWWIWVCTSFRSWWWIRKPGVFQSMGSQRVGHDWATELNWPPVESIIRLTTGELRQVGNTGCFKNMEGNSLTSGLSYYSWSRPLLHLAFHLSWGHEEKI